MDIDDGGGSGMQKPSADGFSKNKINTNFSVIVNGFDVVRERRTVLKSGMFANAGGLNWNCAEVQSLTVEICVDCAWISAK